MGAEPPNYVTTLFQRDAHVYEASDGTKVRISYATFKPKTIQKGKKYPLLVWLHGAGQRGSNNTAQLRHLDETVMPRMDEDDYPLFILAPQAPRELSWSGEEPGTKVTVTSRDGHKDMLDITIAMIDNMIEKHPIDADRVVLIGLSSGGSAAWELADRFPDRFAAVLPFGSNPAPDLSNERLVKTKIWAFHSPIDKVAPVTAVEATIESLQTSGGKAALSYDCDNPSLDDVNGNHFCFTGPFIEYDLLSWILAQDGDAGSPEPGQVMWASRLRWPYIRSRLLNASPVVACIVVLAAMLGELRRKRNRSVERALQTPDAAPLIERT